MNTDYAFSNFPIINFLFEVLNRKKENSLSKVIKCIKGNSFNIYRGKFIQYIYREIHSIYIEGNSFNIYRGKFIQYIEGNSFNIYRGKFIQYI